LRSWHPHFNALPDLFGVHLPVASTPAPSLFSYPKGIGRLLLR
jgi:hypothetical protein